jgi:hypothetical protein
LLSAQLPLSFASLTDKYLLPKYFKSEWSFAQFRIPDFCKSKITSSLVAFSGMVREPHSITVVTSDGDYYKLRFNPEQPGPNCFQQEHSGRCAAP